MSSIEKLGSTADLPSCPSLFFDLNTESSVPDLNLEKYIAKHLINNLYLLGNLLDN